MATSIKPKPFYELLNMEFVIPPYQRGYRWDNEQVNALLDDLHEFIRKHVKRYHTIVPDDSYYCLQPIAVVKDNSYSEDSDKKKYIVVDGQQRLTTIYILLHYLSTTGRRFPIYNITIQMRDIQNEYLKNKNFIKSSTDCSNNIDNFYIHEAYETIESWFEKNPKREQDKESFINLFAYQPEEDEIVNDVRVIWYEIENQTALDAFRRLNYGKIPLTSTELVKALLLQGNNNPNNGEYSKGAAYRRALEWDAMEKSLHNPYMWSMLAEPSENSLSHIGIILDFVTDRLNEEMQDSETKEKPFVRKEDTTLVDYFNYNVVNEFLQRNKNNGVELVWNEIRKTYNIMTNWYKNRKWYHLIGLLRILLSQKQKQRDFVKYIYDLSVDRNDKPINRPDFTKKLESEIGKIIKLKEEDLETLNYDNNPKEIIKILIALNVKEAIDDLTEDNRFAFHLFGLYKVTSLEHIHPQNITTDAKYDDFKEWVERRGKDYDNLDNIDFENIVKGSNKDLEVDQDTEDLLKLVSELREETSKALKELREITKTKQSYTDEQNKDKLNSATEKLDKFFGDLSSINESELHSIKNLALVDGPTNSALSNYFLDKKREILMSRHNACNLEGRESTYALPATRRVFSKEYSLSSPGDMRLWRREDRDNYFKRIKFVYNYFTLNL